MTHSKKCALREGFREGVPFCPVKPCDCKPEVKAEGKCEHCKISPGSVHYKNCPLLSPTPDWSERLEKYKVYWRMGISNPEYFHNGLLADISNLLTEEREKMKKGLVASLPKEKDEKVAKLNNNWDLAIGWNEALSEVKKIIENS